jgi:hypothetical protein
MNGKVAEVEVARPPSLQHERLTAIKSSSSVPGKGVDVTGHPVELGTDSRLHPVSEDEMSAVSLGQYSTIC